MNYFAVLKLRQKQYRVQLRKITIVGFLTMLMLSYQNCGDSKKMNQLKSVTAASSSRPTGDMAAPGPNNSGTGATTTYVGGPTGGTATFVNTGAATSDTTAGGRAGGSGGSTSGSGGRAADSGSGTETTNNPNNCTFKADELCITKDLPSSVNLVMKNNGSVWMDSGQITLSVEVFSGAGGTTYQWKKDGQTLSGDNKKYYLSGAILNIATLDYSVQGSYTVAIYDKNGRRVNSKTAQVNVVEDSVGCAATSYYASKVDYIGSLQGINRFSNAGGVWLLHNGYANNLGLLTSHVSSAQYRSVSIAAASFGNMSSLDSSGGCSLYLPNIHEDIHTSDHPNRQNCTYYEGGSCTAYYGHWTGALAFQCKNNKWKLVSNSCQWVDDPPPPVDYGGGG